MDPLTMTSTKLDYLFRTGSPVISLGIGEKGREKWNPSHFYSSAGTEVCVRRLRGNKMRTTQALMDEFGAALQLFEGFGENWHALEECLSYLDEWLPADAYVLVVERAEELLVDDKSADLAALLKTLDAAGSFWSKPVSGSRFERDAVPFHVLLNLSNSDASMTSMERISNAAGEAGVVLRDG